MFDLIGPDQRKANLRLGFGESVRMGLEVDIQCLVIFVRGSSQQLAEVIGHVATDIRTQKGIEQRNATEMPGDPTRPYKACKKIFQGNHLHHILPGAFIMLRQ